MALRCLKAGQKWPAFRVQGHTEDSEEKVMIIGIADNVWAFGLCVLAARLSLCGMKAVTENRKGAVYAVTGTSTPARRTPEAGSQGVTARLPQNGRSVSGGFFFASRGGRGPLTAVTRRLHALTSPARAQLPR